MKKDFREGWECRSKKKSIEGRDFMYLDRVKMG